MCAPVLCFPQRPPSNLVPLPCFFNIRPFSTLNKQCKIVHKSPSSSAPPTLHSMISLLLLTLKSSFSPHVFIICLAAFLQPRAVSSPVLLKCWSYRPLEGQSWALPFLVESGKCMCLGPCSFSLVWLFSDFFPMSFFNAILFGGAPSPPAPVIMNERWLSRTISFVLVCHTWVSFSFFLTRQYFILQQNT